MIGQILEPLLIKHLKGLVKMFEIDCDNRSDFMIHNQRERIIEDLKLLILMKIHLKGERTKLRYLRDIWFERCLVGLNIKGSNHKKCHQRSGALWGPHRKLLWGGTFNMN